MLNKFVKFGFGLMLIGIAVLCYVTALWLGAGLLGVN